jgi:hypothetical protein
MLGRPISSLALGEENTDDDLALLTLAELYEAAGLEEDSDGTHDAELTALGDAIGEIFAGFCNVRAAEGSRPTLMMQSLVETFELDAPITGLVLARRPVQEIASIAATSGTLAETDYTVVKGAGIVRRAHRGRWCGEIVVTYTGGLATVPDALRYAAIAMVKDIRAAEASAIERDQSVRAVSVEGVGSVQYAVDSAVTVAGKPLIPSYIATLLAPYVNPVI